MAVPFDPNRLEVSGTPTAVLPGVRHPGLMTAADFGVSRSGMLIYVPGRRTEAGLPLRRCGSTVRGVRPGSVESAPLLAPRNPSFVA